MPSLLANVLRDLFVLAMALFIVLVVGAFIAGESFMFLAALVTPIMLVLGLASGCGLGAGLGKWVRILCLVLIAGLALLIFNLLRSGGALGALGLGIWSFYIGSFFVLVVLVFWLLRGVQRVRGT